MILLDQQPIAWSARQKLSLTLCCTLSTLCAATEQAVRGMTWLFLVKWLLRGKSAGLEGVLLGVACHNHSWRVVRAVDTAWIKKVPATQPCSCDSWMSQRRVECLWTVAVWIYSHPELQSIPDLVPFSKLLLEIWNLRQTKPPETLPCALAEFILLFSPP